METKQEYYKKLVELEYGFLIESIEENYNYPVDQLLAFMLSVLKLDRAYHKQFPVYEDLTSFVEKQRQLLLNTEEKPKFYWNPYHKRLYDIHVVPFITNLQRSGRTDWSKMWNEVEDFYEKVIQDPPHQS